MKARSRNPQRILVAQLARFGDFLQTTPLIAALKRDRPKAQITVLVDRGQEALARSTPDVDEVLAIDLSGLRGSAADFKKPLSAKVLEFSDRLAPLWRERYDWVINLNTSRIAALLAELIPARRRSGPRPAEDRLTLATAPWADYIMTLMKCRRLIRFNLVDLLASYAEIKSRVGDGLVYRVIEPARKRGVALLGSRQGPFIGFQLGSRHLSRQWPPESFARLARDLINQAGAKIFFLGTGPERPLGQAVLKELSALDSEASDRVIDLMGATSIEELGGVLSGLDLLITTDTGTMHLAAAVKTPILALFMGPAFCHETGPYGRGHVILQAAADCSPCTEGGRQCRDFKCRRLIRPETAFSLAVWMLEGQTGPPPMGQASPGVKVLISDLDDFGVVYRPLVPWAVNRTEILALAYREAGRRFIRPGYRSDKKKLSEEFGLYLPEARYDPAELAREMDARVQKGLRPEYTADEELAPLENFSSILNRRGQIAQNRQILEDVSGLVSLAAATFRAGRPHIFEESSKSVEISSTGGQRRL